MRALKILVVVMGVLIVAGFIALAVGLYQKAGRMGGGPEPAQAPEPAAFGTVRLELAADARVVAMEAAGERLFVRVREPAGWERIVVVDLKTGRVLGTIEVHARP